MDQQHFEQEVDGFEMTVLRADGLYRHLRCKRPDGSRNWFDIVTWPGNLVVRGEMGTFGFNRLDDMFEFFRADIWHNGRLTPNLSYWTEKLVTAKRETVFGYREDAAEKAVRDHVASAISDEALRTECLNEVLPYIAGEEDLENAMSDFDADARSNGADGVFDSFDFDDCIDWDHHYQWCCYAILWAIRGYDRQHVKAEAA